MGAPVGNKNAIKSKIWTAAIERALEKRSKRDQIEAIDELAEKFLERVEAGDMQAFKELGDRLEGKPAQAINVGGQEDNPLKITGGIELVRPKD